LVHNKEPNIGDFDKPMKSHRTTQSPLSGLQRPLPDIVFDPKSKAAQSRQLALALKQHLASKLLLPGTKLPPTREAARQLKVSRGTVVDAYAELTASGLLLSQGRNGTSVAARLLPRRTVSHVQPTLVSRLVAPRRTAILELDWRVGQACTQLLPLDVWRAAMKEAGRHLPPPDYGEAQGVLQLRQAIAHWLEQERSVKYDATQIVVTQGAGQALELLARALIRPGDTCIVETPGYVRAAKILQAAGGRILPIKVDDFGADIQSAFDNQSPALIHLTPAHQYPAGGRLAGERRRLLVNQLKYHKTLLIENEYDHEFIYEGQNFAPIAASIPDSTVLVSTFAKAISPSLRLGFIAAPTAIAAILTQTIAQDRLQVSWPIQRSMQWLMESGELRKHLRRVRRHYGGLREFFLQQLALKCPEFIVRGQEGGLHLLLQCQTDQATERALAALRHKKIAFDTIADFQIELPSSVGILVGYGQMTQTEIEVCVDQLRSALTA
jgi:GntR family transcriptional regulator / MocR family aminotransferase